MTIKEQEEAERQAARKKKFEEKAKELETIKNLLAKYNAKYNDTLCLGITRTAKKGDQLLSEIFSLL